MGDAGELQARFPVPYDGKLGMPRRGEEVVIIPRSNNAEQIIGSHEKLFSVKPRPQSPRDVRSQ